MYIQIYVSDAKDDKEKLKAKGKCDAIYQKNPCLKASGSCETCINTKVGQKTCTFDGHTKKCVLKKPNKNTLFHLSNLLKDEKPAAPDSDEHRQNVELVCTCAEYWHADVVVETCHNKIMAQNTKRLAAHIKRIRKVKTESKNNEDLSRAMTNRKYIPSQQIRSCSKGGASGTSGDVVFCSYCKHPGKKFAVKIYREERQKHQPPNEIKFYTEYACKHFVHYEGFTHYEMPMHGKANVHGLVMEACDHSLDAISWEKNLLTEQDKLQILIDVANGLIHMHSKGIVWADLKPENVMIGCGKNKGKYRAKLADFEQIVGGGFAGSKHTRGTDAPKCAAVNNPEKLNWSIQAELRGSARSACLLGERGWKLHTSWLSGHARRARHCEAPTVPTPPSPRARSLSLAFLFLNHCALHPSSSHALLFFTHTHTRTHTYIHTQGSWPQKHMQHAAEEPFSAQHPTCSVLGWSSIASWPTKSRGEATRRMKFSR